MHKLTDFGVIVEGTKSIEIGFNKHNKRYLRTKKERMNHKLNKL